MRALLLIGCLTLLSFTQHLYADSEAAAEPAGYAIQPGDILQISVWKEEGLQSETIVAPDGMASFPLVGHLMAAGKTPAQFEQEIAAALTKYIPEPEVNVAIRQLNGYKIYVIGKVNRVGEYVVNRDVDVMQALAMAGGMNPYADLKDIKVLRRGTSGEAVIPFNYNDIENGRNLESNIVLQAGDVVVVP
jgi:polysaccharide export outer membrane protein